MREVFLTGLPVSTQMEKILHNLENGIYVSMEEIESTLVMKTARAFTINR